MLIAIIDCNNFYVSCERVFQPKLAKTPIAILSNNDGCIIARSNEVKKLGIPMGAPYFKHKELLERQNIQIFSSNYTLYGDISARVMEIVKELCYEVEIYSIDEAFFSLDGIKDPLAFCKKVQKALLKWVGIPVSIGIAPTKVLAKIANRKAKTTPSTKGIYFLQDDSFLKSLPVEEVWGVGGRLSKKLKALQIFTAYELKKADPFFLKKKFSVLVERIIHELNGTSCIPLEVNYQKRKSLVVSRSFGAPLTSLEDLQEALANYVCKACHKLRKEKQMAKHMGVFLHTNLHAKNKTPYYKQIQVTFSYHTDNTFSVLKASMEALQKIYLPGLFYVKTGILLSDLVDTHDEPQDLLDQRDRKKTRQILKALDQVNQKYGKNTITPARCFGKQKYGIKAEHQSPRFTTHFEELLTVR